MSYTSALQVGKSTRAHACLVIDGIPVLFGTRSGLTLDTTSVFINGPTSLTSAAAMLEVPTLDGQKLNFDSLVVEPGGAKVVLRRSPAWDKYFQSRRPGTRLTQALNGTQISSFSVASNSTITAGQVAYIDRECVLVDALDGPQGIELVSRQYCTLVTNRESTLHTIGSFVSPVPPSLIGRSAELHVWSSETDSTLLRRLILKHVQPDNARGVWELSFEDCMALYDKKVASGYDAAVVKRTAYNNSSSNPTVTIDVNDDPQFAPTVGGVDGAVMVRHGGYAFIGDIASYDGNNPQVSMLEFAGVTGPQGGSPYFSLFVNSNIDDDTTARRVYVLTGNPMTALLRVLLSDRGDGDNSATYDVLHGVTASGTGGGDALSAYETERRMGAAIPSAMLNLSTSGDGLLNPSVLNEATSGFAYVLGHDGEESLLELMRDVAIHHQGFFYNNNEGKLSFKRLAGTYPSTTVDAALTETNVLRISSLVSVNDETEVVHTIGVDCNYDPGNSKFLGKVNVRYARTHELYKDSGRELIVKCRAFMVQEPQLSLPLYAYAYGVAPTTLADLISRFNRQFYRRQSGVRKVKVSVPWRYSTLVPGSVVTLTHSGYDALNGSAFTGEKMLVTAVDKLDIATGVVDLQLEEVWTGKPVCPAGRVSSWSGGPPQVATLTSSSKYGGGAIPGDYFAVGDKVRIFDYSASPPFSTASAVLTVSAKTSTTVTVTGVVGFTPAAGDVLVYAQYDDADNTADNVAESISQREHAFLSDAGWTLGTSVVSFDFYG